MSFSVRPATAADAARCAEIYRPFVTDNWVSFETDPPGEAEMQVRIAACSASHAWLIAQTPTGEIAGYAYGSPHRTRAAYATSADVAVYVDPAFARQGIGRALYAALFPCFEARAAMPLSPASRSPIRAASACMRPWASR